MREIRPRAHRVAAELRQSAGLLPFGGTIVALLDCRLRCHASIPSRLEFSPGASHFNLAGAEGFEPPSSVLETDSLTVELTPLKTGVRGQVSGVSLLRSRLQTLS